MSGIDFREEEAAEEVCRQVMTEGIWQNSRVVFLILHVWEDTVWKMTEQMAAGGVVVVVCLVTDDNVETYRKYGSMRERIVVIPVEAELEGRL